jgi:chloramphenicol 3-O phosphotransferase
MTVLPSSPPTGVDPTDRITAEVDVGSASESRSAMSARGVFLHGPSSSGKTALARAIQLKLPEPWLVLDADTALRQYPYDHPRFQPDDNRHWARAYLVMVRALVQEGFGVIAEQILWTDGHVVDCREVLGDLPILFIRVSADLEVAEAREAARPDRGPGTARYQYENVCWNLPYDLTVDTSRSSPDEAAVAVVEWLTSGASPTALQRLAPCGRPPAP